MKHPFETQLHTGTIAESLIARWIRSQGCTTLPACLPVGQAGGPSLTLPDGSSLCTPDLLICKNGVAQFVEVKSKREFSWYRLGSRWESGMDRYYFEQYLAAQHVTGLVVKIVWLHDTSVNGSPTGLYGATLDEMRENISHESDRYGRGGMIYWSRHVDGGALHRLASVADLVGPPKSITPK